ncbi:hypothetical protein [Chitinophaga sp. 22620]|uniref:hypothetical protein n=1 Tax=Chitinophaga sp. 22620 TaxID=3453952 RepID=UPI003F855FC1
MKLLQLNPLNMQNLLFAAAFILLLPGCSKRDAQNEKLKPEHIFAKLPPSADGRLRVFADSLLVKEEEHPWMDSVLNHTGAPGWEYAAFGIQTGSPSAMVPLIDHSLRKVTGLLVMVNGPNFQYRIIDSRRPEKYGYNNGKNVANARTIFIASDLFNQRAFPDAGAAPIGECMMTRKERQFFENARRAEGSFTPIVRAAGYALSITCYTTMACTGDGRGNCVGNITYHTDCIYNYIWIDGGYGSGTGSGYTGGGVSGGGGSSTGNGSAPPDPCGAGTPPQENEGPLAVLPPAKPISNVQQYLSCFDPRTNAKITFYADQPEAGSSQLFTTKEKVGHAYISIEQYSGGRIVRRTVGYHPFEPIAPFFTIEGRSQLGDDSNSEYDVRLSVPITSSQLQTVLALVENYNPHYHLENYNCTNFVLDISDACGLHIPRTKGWWLVGSGLNPASFGEDLKKIPGAVVGEGSSHENSGVCN